MVAVVVKDPSGDKTIRQHVLRGVTQGTIEPHFWAQHNGVTFRVPVGVPIELTAPQASVLLDAGYTVEEVE